MSSGVKKSSSGDLIVRSALAGVFCVRALTIPYVLHTPWKMHYSTLSRSVLRVASTIYCVHCNAVDPILGSFVQSDVLRIDFADASCEVSDPAASSRIVRVARKQFGAAQVHGVEPVLELVDDHLVTTR